MSCLTFEQRGALEILNSAIGHIAEAPGTVVYGIWRDKDRRGAVALLSQHRSALLREWHYEHEKDREARR